MQTISELNDRWKREEPTYLRGIGLLRLVVEGLRASGHGVPTGCGGAILRGAHEFDSTTLDDDVGGWWKILRVTDRVAVPQQTGLLAVQGVNLSATVGKGTLLLPRVVNCNTTSSLHRETSRNARSHNG